MESSRWIKEGEWFCAVQGFAIAEKLYNFYFEEYDHIPQNKKVGDYKLSAVKYKLFCDFDGHLIRRNRCKIFNISWCSPMNAKLKRVLQKSIKDNPKEYTSFINFLEKPQEMKGWEVLEYKIPADSKVKAIQDMERIKKDLPLKFTFPELMKAAADHGCVIDLTDFLKTLVWLNTIFALRLIILMEIVSIKGSCLIDLAMKLSDERPTMNKQACEEGATILAVPALCRL